MTASSKFDLSSGSPDTQLYGYVHHVSYGAASLDRSGSLREYTEKPLLSSVPNMTRSNSSATRGDVLNFLSCVRIDPKSMVVEHKLNRPGEFERLASAAVGMPLEDSPPMSSKSKHLTSPALDDIRRLKSGVLKSGTKARERMKTFNDCLSVINKLFPTIPTRKRSRLDALSSDRFNTSLIDSSASGLGIGKMGLQNHFSANDFELEQQKAVDRTKNTIPSKRNRTSMADARMDAQTNNLARLPGTVDKDRESVRKYGSYSVQGEDRTLSTAVDGWEQSKMKKKRTGIKQDNAASSITKKVVDSYRDPKQGTHPRLRSKSCLRSADAYGFRSGSANGGMQLGKVEATSPTNSGMQSSMPHTDSDNSSFLHEMRERSNGQEKDRMNLNSLRKEDSREDISCSSPTPDSNLNANVRAPRSDLAGCVSKLAQGVQQSISPNDWDISNCTNKITGGIGANSRKRTPSTRSSSPVSNWVQRPQKISRTARRTNLLPIVSGNEENPDMDTDSEMMVNDGCFPAHSSQQSKIKGDNTSPAALSESEGSGAAEIKSRDKNKKCDELDEKSVQNVQKLSAVLLPLRKKKAVTRDHQGDGVTRQRRSGRGSTSSRSLLPLPVEKHGSVVTNKQIRSSKLGLDKTESRAGRPPSRKLSDRKAYTRQKHNTFNTGADFLVGPDDGHAELLSAANAVINTAQSLSSPFWKKMEPIFQYITDVDISYLKEQVNSGLAVDTPDPVPLDTASCTLVPDCESNEWKEGTEARSIEPRSEHVAPGVKKRNEVSLYQRLIAALIPEEEADLEYDVHESPFEMEKYMGSDTFCSHTSPSCDPSECPTSNGCDVKLNGRLFYELEHNIMLIPSSGFSNFDHSQNDLGTNKSISSTICSDVQYQNMSINERLIMEIHSIGIYPDIVSRNEELNGDITRLDERYQEQVIQKKSLLGKVLCFASDAKKLQQKEFEGLALDKLVGMAYEKYMGFWGPNAHGLKSAGGKMAKQAAIALAFVKRTMERYLEFEETGKSCFDDPLYKDNFLSGVSRLIDGQPLNSSTDNESGKLHLGASGCFVGVRNSAPLGMQQSPSSNNQDICSSGKEDSCSNRMKKREVLLDNVGGVISFGLGGSLSCSAKGKRSGRDREGKGNYREAFSKSGTTKLSRTVSTSAKGDRKLKAKPEHNFTHLSASSVNGSLGNMGEQTKEMLSSTHKSSGISRSNSGKDKNDYATEMLEGPIDLSALQLPDMDDLGVPDDLGGHGEDLGSWLMNIEDDSLHDNDFMGGLGIPMDDLTELNMMV